MVTIEIEYKASVDDRGYSDQIGTSAQCFPVRQTIIRQFVPVFTNSDKCSDDGEQQDHIVQLRIETDSPSRTVVGISYSNKTQSDE